VKTAQNIFNRNQNCSSNKDHFSCNILPPILLLSSSRHSNRNPHSHGMDRAMNELGRVRKPGTGDRKLEKDAEGRGRSREGRAVFMVVEKAARLVHAHLP